MIEYQREEQIEMLQSRGFLVKVIGVGGAGSNVLDQIALDGMEEAELICMNTDVRTLKTSTAHSKVQIGKQLTRGLGAGGDPELGILAAEEAEAEIRAALKGQDMVFICTGLGGGTGSGAAPTISRIAKEEGAFVVVFATMPFSFEGRRRIQQAETALKLMERSADALITFENDRMGELVLPKEGIQQAFGNADKIISQSVRAITNVVTQPGLIQIGMDDLLTALKNPVSRCLFGYGSAKGKNRAQEALKIAMRSPLLDRGKLLEKSNNALVHVVGGSSMSLYEVELLMNEMSKNVGSETQILFGAATDEKMEDHLSVTIISSLTLEELRRHESAAGSIGGATGSSLGFASQGSTAELAEPSSPVTTSPEEAPTASPEPIIEPTREPKSVVEELLGEDDLPIPSPDSSLEEAEAEAKAKAKAKAAEEEAAKASEADATRQQAEVAQRQAEEEAARKAAVAKQEAEAEAEAERARHEAFLKKKEELRKAEALPAKAKAEPVAEEAPAKPRATADDLMAQRRQAQEELERKRAELEKLLKLEDEARRKRATKPKSAAAPAAPPAVVKPTPAAMIHPGDDLAAEDDLDMSDITTSDLDQTTRIPVETPRSTPPSAPRQAKAAPKPPPAKSLESRKPERSSTTTSERPDQGKQAELQLDPLRGRFEKSSPTVMEGENLDVPTFFRRRGKKG